MKLKVHKYVKHNEKALYEKHMIKSKRHNFKCKMKETKLCILYSLINERR